MESPTVRRLLGASSKLGAPRVWDLLRGGRVKILMYHGIPSRERFEGVENYYRYNVPVAEFERHMAYLKRNCNVISLQDFRSERGLSASKTNIVITFDDGYENNCTNAFPILEKFELPAVFALTTGFVGGREPLYNDLVEYAVQHCERSSVTLEWEGETYHYGLEDFGARLRFYNWAMRLCVTIGQERRAELIETIIAATGVEASADALFGHLDYRPLTRKQVTEMARSPLVEFAAHSVHHYLLAHLQSENKRRELVESRAGVEELTGGACRTFCVPGGAYDREVLDEATAAGYDCVLTSDVGPAVRGNTVLRRYGIFSREDMGWFTDVVHGPVFELLEKAREVRGSIQSRLGLGNSR